MTDPAETRKRARLAWHVALGASAVAAVGMVPVFIIAHWVGRPPFLAVLILGVVAAAIPVTLGAALLALWLSLTARDAERRREIEVARSATSVAPKRDRGRPA